MHKDELPFGRLIFCSETRPLKSTQTSIVAASFRPQEDFTRIFRGNYFSFGVVNNPK